MSVLLFRSARPGPLLRALHQARLDWVPFDVSRDPTELVFAPYRVIKGFILPELFSSSTQNAICFTCGKPFVCFGVLRQ